MSATEFLKARDFLFAHREDYHTAYREFRWPVLDRFNWALDYFDPMARGNDKPALWIVNEGGGEVVLTELPNDQLLKLVALDIRSALDES